MRYAQLVMGPAGCGKSTYCQQMHEHGLCSRRNFRVVNLDPAAENFNYPVSVDVRYGISLGQSGRVVSLHNCRYRELISLEDVMEELDYGPNGGLVYCFEYLCENLDWYVPMSEVQRLRLWNDF